MANQSSEFSFDVYPGLDAELEAAYGRNVAMGMADPSEIAQDGLATAIQNTLGQQPLEAKLSPLVNAWLPEELEGDLGNHALEAWCEYETKTGMSVPHSIEELAELHLDFEATVARLYEAKVALNNSGEYLPGSTEELGNAMHLVLIPWQHIKDNLENFPDWVKSLREAQGVATTDDYFNENILNRIMRENGGLYRNPSLPGELFSAKRYLDLKIEQDGPWGIMLAQTSREAGIDRLVQGPAADRTPDALTNNGTQHFEVAGQQVDDMGVFEWVALTLQRTPNELSTSDYSWLLANRLEVDGEPHVPFGCWVDSRVYSDLDWASVDDGGMRPRLAVM